MKKLIVFLSLLVTVVAVSSCDRRQDTLDRPLAKEMLNEDLKLHQVFNLSFRKGGIDRAVKDGLIEKNTFSDGYFFTKKGLKLVGTYIGKNYGIGSEFRLTSPISEVVDEVTGITAAPQYGAGHKQVEFTTRYVFPEEMRGISGYIFTGTKAKAVFRKYDDGWRIVK